MENPNQPDSNSPYEVHRTVLPEVLNAYGLLGEGVEVGVRQGEFSAHILTHWRGRKLWLVDAWTEHDAYEETHHAHDQNLFATLNRMRAFPDRYEVVRAFSVEAAKRFTDESLDFVYLDADHSYEAVRDDIAAWWPKLKPGGLFAGDDYGAEPVVMANFEVGVLEFGVKQAVDEFAIRERKNVSTNWLGDWWFGAPQGMIRSRNWWLIK